MVVKRKAPRLVATALALAVVLSLPRTAGAQSVRVNSLDGGSVAGACTITDAVAATNAGHPVNGCSTNMVGGYIGFDVSGTITLNLPLVITSFAVIDATGQTVRVSGGNHTELFVVVTGATLQLLGLTLSNGVGFEFGAVQNYGLFLAHQCTFTDNHGSVTGAIDNNGVMIITSSTFYGNDASLFPYAGAIRNNDRAQIANSTLSGNFAFAGLGGERNGAIGNTANGNLTLANTTITANGGIVGGVGNAGALFLVNTLIGGNGAVDCAGSGTVTAYSVNLIADGSCHVTGALTGDPKLGPLADNGGGTLTHALLDGSPAIDAGDDGYCAVAPVSNHDQRGRLRPQDGNGDGVATCDIGSFERARPLPFSGFLAPVDPMPVVNVVKAGRAVPVKFKLGGNRGLDIFADGYPASRQVACDTQSAVSDVEETVTAGGSSLTYDAASDTYTYVWKTSAAWAGTCRQFVLGLNDDTAHVASFRFK